ncbi:MAG: pyridoxal-5'-phosphate-dependent protein subunit beta, partial [Acidimicrobiia bacterium]|nr:pyridoxal-5'-phosphate-dependent protein subunit beta [Acidimicrobiia bacterium]
MTDYALALAPTLPRPPDVGLARDVVDGAARASSVARFAERGIRLPTFAELRDPSMIDAETVACLATVDRRVPDAANLFRVHWYNQLAAEEFAAVPEHLELPSALTGVPARIVLALGNRFPMIDTHKVLAAYGCLAPRVVTGRFDPDRHRAIWPSTGNYARGGVAISRIMDCHGVAVLPAGMSQERFDWLQRWTLDPASDIIRTPGTESNVREIYVACNELALDPTNVVINQFCEFPNYLVHRTITGPAMEHVYRSLPPSSTGAVPGGGRLAGFVSATGSAGTLAAGDYLKEVFGAEIIAAEALECPTLLENGFGEHNIQGIGDKHVPLIHNVANTDVVVAISDRLTDQLDVLFQSEVGRDYLVTELGLDQGFVHQLENLGYSSICNLAASIAYADLRGLGPDDVVLSVATDGAALYDSGRAAIAERDFGGPLTPAAAAATFARHLGNPAGHAVLDLDDRQRRRIFNLGYFTWVEQLNLDIDTFVARRDQRWWDDMLPVVDVWDDLIT